MSKQIDFYYEFSSPYGYLAAMEIDALAARHGAMVNWHPFLLGAVFKTVGTKPLLDYPIKGAYSENDMYRTARLYGHAMSLPEKFPFMAVNACRLVLWAAGNDQEKRAVYSKGIYRACYEKGHAISDKAVLLDVANELGLDREAAAAGIASSEIKAMLMAEVDAGIEAGVFGSPFFIVDGEAFWGFDRMTQLDRWLETGGW